MLAKYLSIIRNYVLSISLQRKYNYYLQNTLPDAFRTNSRIIIGRSLSMVIPLLANQDLTPMLSRAIHLNILEDDQRMSLELFSTRLRPLSTSS